MIIDGKTIAHIITDNLKEAIAKLKGRKPSLSFICVGDNPSSLTYIKMKQKRCTDVGITSVDLKLPESVSEQKLLDEVKQLNANPEIDGILVQLPLPPHIDPVTIISAIDPTKDVDGFHPINMGKLLMGERDGFIPCTPYGIQVLLDHAGIDVQGKHVVIIGRSNIVGKPLAALLMQKQEGANATVTVVHSHSANLTTICRSADILIAAIGHAHFVKKEMVKDDAVVIDVGINRLEGEIVGDVDFDNVAPKCLKITPVPGGIGPMTIAMLLSNTLLSYQRRTS